MTNHDLKKLSTDQALDLVARLIDEARDKKSKAGTDAAFNLLEELEKSDRAINSEQFVLLHYFRANAYDNRCFEVGETQSWNWDLPNTQNQILELRKAIRHEGFCELPNIRQCQILTNLGNLLNTIGRFIEAIESWDRAIALIPNFAMALGNKGFGLKHYAKSVYDLGHAGILIMAAHESLDAATDKNAFYESPESDTIKERFALERDYSSQLVDLTAAKEIYKKDYKLGRSNAERTYRSWVLHNRLFINPLNDCGAATISAQDIVTLPSIRTSLLSSSYKPPAIFGFYNQMKQELASARYLLFEGLHSDGPHFSDKNNLLYNTLDYPSYSLATEKIRSAYKISYSLFDKIAFFINHYFNVGCPERQVNFRSIWYEHKGSPPGTLRAIFDNRSNWPLRGLYWLSKDLFDNEIRTFTEPDAEALADIRNHLEHKYLQIHEDWGLYASTVDGDTLKDDLGYHLSRSEFEDKTLRILKLARAALIYLSLAVHHEEKQQDTESGNELIAASAMDIWRDEWKT